MSILFIHTDEKIFSNSWIFKSKRWQRVNDLRRRKVQMIFSKDERNCVDLNLAQIEMFLTVTATARYDMNLFEIDLSNVRFQHDYYVTYSQLEFRSVRAIVRNSSFWSYLTALFIDVNHQINREFSCCICMRMNWRIHRWRTDKNWIQNLSWRWQQHQHYISNKVFHEWIVKVSRIFVENTTRSNDLMLIALSLISLRESDMTRSFTYLNI